MPPAVLCTALPSAPSISDGFPRHRSKTTGSPLQLDKIPVQFQSLGIRECALIQDGLTMTRDLPRQAASANPLVQAYFNGIESAQRDEEETVPAGARSSETAESTAASAASDGTAILVDILMEAGVVAPPRALLNPAPETPQPLPRLHRYLEQAAARDKDAFSKSTAELAYLGNTLLSGCSVQARPFTPREASDAAAATCNLGLENWPTDCPGPDDLVSAFQLGWRVLYDDVSMFAAKGVLEVLNALKCSDRHIQAGLDELRFRLRRAWLDKTPWAARDALDVLTSLDM